MEDITVYATETGAVLDYPEWMTEEEALVRVYAFLAGKNAETAADCEVCHIAV